jgi:hypothetical protein
VFAQRGRRGEIRAGPSVAARFVAWTLERPDDVLASDVAMVDVESQMVVDTFLFGHSSLDIWLDCGTAWWVWRGATCSGSRWTTRGGRPEVRLK